MHKRTKTLNPYIAYIAGDTPEAKYSKYFGTAAPPAQAALDAAEGHDAPPAGHDAPPAGHDTVVARDKRCTIYVEWTETVGTGVWMRPGARHTRAPVTVHFANGGDLLEQLQRFIPACRWDEVWISAQAMSQRFASWVQVYDTWVRPLSDFAWHVDIYCRAKANEKRWWCSIPPGHAVPVEIQLRVEERLVEDWDAANLA
jgi:hypothetical protein